MNSDEEMQYPKERSNDTLWRYVGSCSVQGTKRDNNEDSFYTDPDGDYFLVADGIGGCQAGEVASQMAVQFLSECFDQLCKTQIDAATIIEKIQSAFLEANDLILSQKGSDGRLSTMGTTAVAALIINQSLYVAGLGDSRAYLIRNAEVIQLTEDHTLAQGLVEAGILSAENARRHAFRSVLWKFLGCEEFGDGVKVNCVELHAGDSLLLTTDGLTDSVKREEFGKLIAGNPDPQKTACLLIKTAREHGATDDVTCVTVLLERAKEDLR